MPVAFANLQIAYDAVWLNVHADQLARPAAMREAVVAPAALITAPPPPNSYVCNPAHIFVTSTPKSTTKPLVFDAFYETVLQGIDYAIDDQGRSYLALKLQILNDK